MLTSTDFYNTYGHPSRGENMLLWQVPVYLQVGKIPKRIYCNADIVQPLIDSFRHLILSGCVHELKTWDGCHNFRPIRGYEKIYNTLMAAGKLAEAIKYLSIHSWGGAIDVNAAENGLGKEPKLSPGFVSCFTGNGLEWGGAWKRKDGMHFQLKEFPKK